MTVTCENPTDTVSAALQRLRDVTRALYRSQEDMRCIAYERREIVRDLHGRGMTYTAIAEAIGMAPQTVWQMARGAEEAGR